MKPTFSFCRQQNKTELETGRACCWQIILLPLECKSHLLYSTTWTTDDASSRRLQISIAYRPQHPFMVQAATASLHHRQVLHLDRPQSSFLGQPQVGNSRIRNEEASIEVSKLPALSRGGRATGWGGVPLPAI